jgi:hypothetical protein
VQHLRHALAVAVAVQVVEVAAATCSLCLVSRRFLGVAVQEA